MVIEAYDFINTFKMLMTQSFTLNQCLRLVYNELTPEESDMLREVIEFNDVLGAEYEKMKATRDALSKRRFAPRRSSINRILRYSQDKQLQLSH